MKRSYKNEKGITLVEVLICVIIVALVIGPMTLNFTTAGRTKEAAERVTIATNRAENLMKDIKTRITEDILLKQEFNGNRSKLGDDTAKTNRYNHYVNRYITDAAFGPSPSTIPLSTTLVNLKDFLANTNFEADYVNDENGNPHYAYEVIMWPLSSYPNVMSGDNELTIDTTTLNTVDYHIVKLYSNNQPGYKFDATDFNSMTNPIKFTLTDQVFKSFQDESQRFIPFGSPSPSPSPAPGVSPSPSPSVYTNYDLIEQREVKAKLSGTPRTLTWEVTPKTGSQIEVEVSTDQMQMDNGSGTSFGYVITVKPPSGVTLATESNKMYVVDVDVTALLRNLDSFSPLATYTMKVNNQTNNHLLMRVTRNYIDSEVEATMDQKFNFVALNSKPNQRISFDYIDDIRPEQNFLIGIIVRETDPTVGKPGKIIKKMVSVYSYDQSINDRR